MEHLTKNRSICRARNLRTLAGPWGAILLCLAFLGPVRLAASQSPSSEKPPGLTFGESRIWIGMSKAWAVQVLSGAFYLEEIPPNRLEIRRLPGYFPEDELGSVLFSDAGAVYITKVLKRVRCEAESGGNECEALAFRELQARVEELTEAGAGPARVTTDSSPGIRGPWGEYDLKVINVDFPDRRLVFVVSAGPEGGRLCIREVVTDLR